MKRALILSAILALLCAVPGRVLAREQSTQTRGDARTGGLEQVESELAANAQVFAAGALLAQGRGRGRGRDEDDDQRGRRSGGDDDRDDDDEQDEDEARGRGRGRGRVDDDDDLDDDEADEGDRGRGADRGAGMRHRNVIRQMEREEVKHRRRVARLVRVHEILKARGNEQAAENAEMVLQKEMERHERAMSRLSERNPEAAEEFEDLIEEKGPGAADFMRGRMGPPPDAGRPEGAGRPERAGRRDDEDGDDDEGEARRRGRRRRNDEEDRDDRAGDDD